MTPGGHIPKDPTPDLGQAIRRVVSRARGRPTAALALMVRWLEADRAHRRAAVAAALDQLDLGPLLQKLIAEAGEDVGDEAAHGLVCEQVTRLSEFPGLEARLQDELATQATALLERRVRRACAAWRRGQGGRRA